MPMSTEGSVMSTMRPETGWGPGTGGGWWGVGGGTIDMPMSTEGSDISTMRPETGWGPGTVGGWLEGVGGGGGGLLTCPCPLKVQSCPQ